MAYETTDGGEGESEEDSDEAGPDATWYGSITIDSEDYEDGYDAFDDSDEDIELAREAYLGESVEHESEQEGGIEGEAR